MSNIERMTITMPAEMAAGLKEVVAAGEYASTSEVVREALRSWKAQRSVQLQELAALKKDIGQGLADIAAGRLHEFDAAEIVKRGRKLLAARSRSD